MKIPKDLRVDGIKIPVIATPPEQIVDRHAVYTTASGTPEIRHQKGLRGDFKALSILHEWGHAVLDMAEVELSLEVEEIITGAFARNALQLLKDVRKGDS